MREMTRNELFQWIEYLNEDYDNPYKPHSKETYLFAWVIYWIRIVTAKTEKTFQKIKFEDCLLKFGGKERPSEPVDDTNLSIEERRKLADEESAKMMGMLNIPKQK